MPDGRRPERVLITGQRVLINLFHPRHLGETFQGAEKTASIAKKNGKVKEIVVRVLRMGSL